MTAAQAETQPETFGDLVREAWQANEGSITDASKQLFALFTSRREMVEAMMPQIAKAWCTDQVRHHVGRIRLAAVTPFDPASGSERLRSVITATLLDFPLPGGKRLGDANSNEVREGAQFYLRSASDASHKYRWLMAVAERVGRANSVQTKLNEAACDALWEATKNDG